MMRSGKDYIEKGDTEYESPRAVYLRELLRSIKPQDATEEDPAKIEPVKSTNQSKPTLKLR